MKRACDCDFILLERILMNLVSNAVLYTVRGGVVVGCRRRAGIVRIEVWDSGIGIPEDQRANIFSEFYQLRMIERGRSGGLGLGLAIVERRGLAVRRLGAIGATDHVGRHSAQIRRRSDRGQVRPGDR